MGYHSCTNFLLREKLCYYVQEKMKEQIHIFTECGKGKGVEMIEYSQIFSERGKRKHGLISNILYSMRSAKEWDTKLFWYQFLIIIPHVAAAFLVAVLPAEVIRGLENQWEIGIFLVHIIAISLLMWVCNMLANSMRQYIAENGSGLAIHYSQKCFQKIMCLDYHMLEQQENQKLIGNVWNSLRNGYNVGTVAVQAFPVCASCVLACAWYGIMLAHQSVLLVGLMILSISCSLALLSFARKKHREYHVELSRNAREAAYLSRQSMDSSAGKDIRIYQMSDWFLKKYDDMLASMDDIFGHIHNWYLVKNLSDCVLFFLQDVFAYGYLIYLLVQNQITAAEFVLYMGLVRAFSVNLETLIRHIMLLNPTSVAVSYVREFLDMPSHVEGSEETGIGIERLEELLEKPLKVELRDVSYTYPGQAKPTLSHINLTIESGEKLALLGLNGAGKTTMVKLICGFYRPTEGEIYFNGIPAGSLTREENYKLVTVLFQDSTMLPSTLDDNLTGTDRKEEKLSQALAISGFTEKYHSLIRKGKKAQLVKEVNENAVEFSGGEKQKFLFARALYKDASLMILDEPTAALDPIAENEMYLKYKEATKGRTSIYISHRLSSTRFCDRIILLEHGRIVEEGTHESLLEEDGRYAYLYQIQGQYYRNKEEQIRLSKIMGDTYIEEEAGKEGVFHE